MSESFSVGEIAFLQNGTHITRYDGEECEVVGALGTYLADMPDGSLVPWRGCYRVCISDGTYLISEPHQLRKRRPPQDWVKLCHLNETPREVEHV